MFTGIIEELGKVEALLPGTAGAKLTVHCPSILAGIFPGASIAVNGCCLTAARLAGDRFTSDLAPETLARTNLGQLQTGSLINLERPLAASGRFDGHIVQGHIDGTAIVQSCEPLGDGNWWLRIDLPAEFQRYVVAKGSVALDGISLTVAALEGATAAFAIIPHTWQHTNLRTRQPGDRLNLETDILARYVEKLVRGI